jgi:hypothetical protein
MLTADEIRGALVCPRCKRTGTIHAHTGSDPSTLSLRLACGGDEGLNACGVIGVFTPPDPLAWSYVSPAGAVAAIQRFLESVSAADGATTSAIAFARENDRIADLEREVRQIAQMVHQAHHGGTPPDMSDLTWEECPMATCRRAQNVLGVARG